MRGHAQDSIEDVRLLGKAPQAVNCEGACAARAAPVPASG